MYKIDGSINSGFTEATVYCFKSLYNSDFVYADQLIGVCWF